MAMDFLFSSEFWTKGKSPVLDSWPLYGDPTIVILILVAYVSFVLYFGPKYMKDRPPYNLKYLIILYNAVQVYYNFWALKLSVIEPTFWQSFFNFGCADLSQEEEDRYMYIVYLVFWHMTMNKILDLLDTVFFVLCKKQNHISFLHVQHHVLSVALTYIGGKYFTGQEYVVAYICNTIVHMTMYFYYFVAALGPAYKKYLWWKKYLTMMQIVQFLIIIVYTVAAIWLNCGFDPRIIWLVILNASLNLGLFLHFFFNTYDSKKLMNDKISMCGSLQFTSNYTENQQDGKSNVNEKKTM